MARLRSWSAAMQVPSSARIPYSKPWAARLRTSDRAPNIVKDSYPPGFRVRLHEKDLKICRAMAARFGVQLPLIEMTLVHYRRLIEQGHGDEDISTLFRLKDALFTAADKNNS